MSTKQSHSAQSAPKQPVSRKGGRPVTWIGGGGLNASFVAGKGVPELRALFLEVFGHPTASNNSAWLRRKLSEPPDATYGRGRSAKIRKRDMGAAIWTTGNVPTFTQAEAAVLHNPDVTSLTIQKVLSAPTARQSMTGSETVQGQPFCTPRKRQRVCGSQPVDKLVQQLKELACPAYWVGSPPTVEVFWPEDAGGGSWWRARVLKVMPKKAQCSVLYDTSEMEDLDLKEMAELKHIRLISPNHEYGESTEMLSTGQERAVMECNMADPTCMRPSANLSITDAVCNSMKSELERLNRSAFPTAISLEDAEREEMLQTILDDTTVSDCTLATISIADTSCEAIRQLSSDTGLESSHLLAPVKIKSEEIDLLAATSMDTKGSDTSGGSFSTLSPYSGIHVPELDMYSAPVVFGGGLSFLPASAPGSVIADSECRLQGPKDRGNVCASIFDEDFMSVGLASLIDEEASSFHNMAAASLLNDTAYY
eukprot:CAMPEP_0177766516 /NCGR_PEP_ID=MMETSP0491_2-20121128/8563_1 /TAXON_ID=63592 /ORGANISM="Tetraselmis chuii, Strain PLY429" /LENGTH=480 /DNA_ID=CAMNT_0019282929 /DNA_START=334 /DNA_END=1776 /DNA_ORIENTATION=-